MIIALLHWAIFYGSLVQAFFVMMDALGAPQSKNSLPALRVFVLLLAIDLLYQGKL